MQWKNTGTTYILEGNGFYISYSPNPSISLMGLFDSNNDGPETALCYDGRYDILNGDFREAYENLISEGLEACKKFYQQQPAYAKSRWTSPRRN